MTETDGLNLFMTLSRGLEQIKNTLPPSLMSQINTLQQTMGSAFGAGAGAAAFRPAFMEFWKIALTQVRDVNFLRTMQPYLRPALGLIGGTWARIEIASLALTGALASEIIMGIMLAILVAVIVIILIWLILKLIDLALSFLSYLWHWRPQSKPQPMQTPNWGNLVSALNDPGFGPLYTINTGNIPSEVKIG